MFSIHHMTCRGICAKYKVKKPNSGEGHYISGHKRCSRCEIFVKWIGIHCPCCNIPLRTKPRNTTGRQQFMLVQKSKLH